jgi:hypothetical protein
MMMKRVALALTLVAINGGAAAQVSSGTAFAVAPGFLVTNHHVIAGCTSVDVVAADGRRTGSIVNSDSQMDLALLRVAGIKGTAARLRTPRHVRLGESVMVFGFPLTGSLSSGGNFTSGIVSALRGLKDAAGEIQITAPVQPGNSGGPLLDTSGLVVGVVQAKLDALRTAIVTGDIPQNVNFAVSLRVLTDFLTKNGVAFRDGMSSEKLDTAGVAAVAQGFTYRIECRGGSRQANASPSANPRRLPVCPGSYDAATWTNCVGEIVLPDGENYVGEFKDGWRSGQGVNTWPDGDKYVGEYKDGKRNGRGTQTRLSGEKYIGEFKDDQYNGQGTYTWPNGEKYIGEFKDDKLDGQGTRTFPDGAKYVGKFRDDKGNGHGTYTWPDGIKHVGEYKDGKRNGRGTQTWPSGEKYIGEFKDGKFDGQGTLYRPNGAILQSGTWANGVFAGGR